MIRIIPLNDLYTLHIKTLDGVCKYQVIERKTWNIILSTSNYKLNKSLTL